MWWGAASPSVPSVPVPLQQEGPRPVAVTAHEPVPAVDRSWNFNRPDSSGGLRVVEGAWKWVPTPGTEGAGCMETLSALTKIEIEMRSLRLPVEIRVRLNPLPESAKKGVFDAGIAGVVEEPGVDVRLPSVHYIVSNSNVWFDACAFISEKAMDQWLNHKRVHLILGKVRPDLDTFQVRLSGRLRLDDLRVREIAAAEVPDLAPYFQALEKIDPTQRVEIQPAPGLQDVRFNFRPPAVPINPDGPPRTGTLPR